MENRTIPSPEFPSPQNPKPNFVVWIAAGVVTLAIGVGVGLAVEKYSPKAQISPPTPSSPAPSECLCPDKAVCPSNDAGLCPEKPPISPKPTANWKTYQGETIYTTDGSTIFQIKYPTEWGIEKNMLYPFGRLEDKGLETRIILGTGGHG